MNAIFSQPHTVLLSGTRDVEKRYHDAKGLSDWYRTHYKEWMGPHNVNWVRKREPADQYNSSIRGKAKEFEAENTQWYKFFITVFRNFDLDFEIMTRLAREEAISHMYDVAQAAGKLTQDRNVDIRTDIPFVPGRGLPIQASQYHTPQKKDPIPDTTLSETLLKYAPGVVAGLGIFKLFLNK